MEKAKPSRTHRRLNSAKPAQGPRLFLFLSLSLNLGLFLFLVLAFRGSERTGAGTSSSPASGDETSPLRVRGSTRHSFGEVFHWSQLESTDLAVYAANLRAAGCPPKTERDILLPLFEEKFAPSEPSVSEPTNFWASFSQRQAAAAARAEQESALEKEKNKALEELLGFAWTSEGLKQAYAGEAAGSVGFVDYDRAEKFLCLADRFKKEFARTDSSRRIDRRSALYQAWRQEVSEILSPAEFEEAELREILMISLRNNPNLCQAGLNSSELRQLMIFRRELRHPLPSALLAKGEELVQEPDWASEQQFQAKVRILLGESRFVNYLQSCDTSFGRTLVALEKERLPRSLALQLFDLRREAMARAQEIRQQPGRRAEKRVQLAALRKSAFEQLAALSSDSPLFRVNQEWLQEIANP